jgi:UDP-N-acetylmuramyl pentapeptide synthase
MNSIKKPISKFVLWYLRALAKLQLKKSNPIIVGVGGASGKTSLSSLISLILKSKYKILSSEGKNSESGIPLSILGLSVGNYSIFDWLRIIILSPFKILTNWSKYKIFIAEMGIDSPFEPKNMSYLFRIVKPKIGVLTNIAYEHSMNFDDLAKGASEEERKEKILDLTAKEELLLLNKLPKEGVAILNIDDVRIEKNRKNIKAKTISVSQKSKIADFFIKETIVGMNQFLIRFVFNNKTYVLRLQNPLPMHYVATICLAIATCSSLGVEVSDSISQIERHFILPPGRFTVFKGVKNTLIIDSSYNNATLQPLLDILELVSKISQNKRKLVILGDLRELGTMSELAHQSVAEKIIATVDYAILIGPLMQKFASPVLEKRNFPFKSFLTFSEAHYFILTNIKSRDVILIKSSQSTLFLERAVEMLLKNPKDKDRLCRRGKYWDKKRQETP